MKFSSRTVFLFLVLILIIFASAACSDDKDKPEPEAKLALTITTRTTTTTDAVVTQALDDQVEKTITKAITKAFIKGVQESDLFSQTVLTDANNDFPDNSKTKTNKVSASIDYLNTGDKKTDVAVVDFTQNIVDRDSSQVEKTGRIYLDGNGVIIGFDIKQSDNNSQSTKAA